MSMISWLDICNPTLRKVALDKMFSLLENEVIKDLEESGGRNGKLQTTA